MNTLHLVALLLVLLGAQASIIRQPDAAPAKPVRAKVEWPVAVEQLNVVPQAGVAPVAGSPKVEQSDVAPPQQQVQAVVVNVVAPKEEAAPDVIAAGQPEESVSNKVAAAEQLADEVQPPAVEQVEPEGRYVKGDASATDLNEFYIPENAANPNITHTHEHHYHKPALYPWLPPPTLGAPTWNYSNNYHSNYPTFPNNFTYPNGLPFLPLLPIPFWKPYGQNNATVPNLGNVKIPQIGVKPADFYLHERSVPHENQQQQQQPQPGLQLIGHIYIYKRPQNGAAAAKPAVPSADDEIFAEGLDSAGIKLDEQFGNSQLLLQPVVYPVGSSNKGEVHPQISEIYRSLHLVHPSAQQRSKAAAPVEDSAVLFAVEIPKPIYRFFKSVVGVFSY